MSADFQRLSICGVPVDHVTVDQLIDSFLQWSRSGQPTRHVCYVNAHVHNLARRDESLRSALHESAICYADGASVVWASRWLGDHLPGRMTGADFVGPLMDRLAAKHRRLFFLGGRPGIAETTARKLTAEISGASPVGCAHGYFPDSAVQDVIRSINRARPDVLIVGMGSPRQERWIAEHRASLKVPLIWAVGALMDYRAGKERRCPPWMGDRGLEWLFRLVMNPRRMAGRYVVGNPSFVCSVLLSRLRGQLAT
jgi:N-acetylglucosaminyldiphosphoundecaprenol N-acetyl-beta-D-mannosaminyltransferase